MIDGSGTVVTAVNETFSNSASESVELRCDERDKLASPPP
jgi:hypothetical protein